jgi:hypothetical protein
MTSIRLVTLSRIKWVGIDLTLRLIAMGFVASPTLGGWKIEWLYRNYQSQVPWSVVSPEVLLIFIKKSKFLKWYSWIAQCVWFLTKALSCLLFPPTSNKLICGAVGRENMWHTCFSYIVKSKSESLGATSHAAWSWCGCMYISQTLKFPNFRMWVRRKIKQEFSHNFNFFLNIYFL